MSNAVGRNEKLTIINCQLSIANSLLLPRFSALLLFFLLLTFLTGCASVAPVVKVGLVAPFEGRYREVGYDAIYSARLAIREVNEAGGIGGYRVALVALDDNSEPELARQAAASLVVDSGVVAVAGHWLSEPSEAAEAVYATADLPFVVLGRPPFVESDPKQLPDEFRRAYEAVTPFDEVPGSYAAATYDAFQLLFLALAQAQQASGTIDRTSVQQALSSIEYNGLTGMVYQP
jgi:ABC-type branched-subunit amino acid transport system substrate-binding protein